MNVFECRNGVLPKGADGERIKIQSECIFRITRIVDGKPKNHGCVLRACKEGKDYYNLYPELDGSMYHVQGKSRQKPLSKHLRSETKAQLATSDSTLFYETSGKVVYQPSNRSDPWKLGSEFGEENLTEHNSGKSFDFRSFDSDIHPKYHRIDYNIPTKSKLEDTDVGDIMGDENPALVHSSWHSEKFEGISSVDVCKNAIYGRFNAENNMIMHTCMKSHVGLPGWINYTNTVEEPNKVELYVGFSTDYEISDYVRNTFKDKMIADRITEALIAVRKGAYCNIWSLLKNNFVSTKTITNFTRKINTESTESIYSKNSWGSRASLEQYVKLYCIIEKMEWKESTELLKIPKKYLQRYKENILNWILNHPMLKQVEIEDKKYKPEDRYWFIIPMLKRALKDGTLNKSIILPPWMVKIIKHKPNPMVKVFGELKRYSDLTDEQKGEFHDAQIIQLDTMNSDSKDSINRQYPGMRVIKPELPADQLKMIDSIGWYQFVLLLHLGRKWSMLEIKNAWEYYFHSYMQDEPSIFYDWLEKVADSPIEPSYTLSKEEFDDIISKNGGIIENYPDEEIEILEEGAIQYNIGDGDLALGNGQGAKFAKNILDASIYPENWKSWDDYEVVKIPLGNWFETSGKVKNHRECQHETFYTMLAASRALKADDNFARKYLSEEGYREVAEASQENVATMGSIIEAGIDNDENFKFLDPSTGEMGHYEEGREGLWLGEE